jgi:hypothetical protein
MMVVSYLGKIPPQEMNEQAGMDFSDRPDIQMQQNILASRLCKTHEHEQ